MKKDTLAISDFLGWVKFEAGCRRTSEPCELKGSNVAAPGSITVLAIGEPEAKMDSCSRVES